MPLTSPEHGAILAVENLTKRFHSHGTTVHAVNGVSFSIAAGETVALAGETGCGKSTVARCLVRLIDPDDGRILFRGADVSALSRRAFRPLRRDVQIVFQDAMTSLNRSFSVRRTLAEPLRLHGLAGARGELEPKLEQLMRLVQLDPALLSRRPAELSGGQRQRVGIARAIATEPTFIVLDEPTSSLDMSLRMALLDLLRDLQARLNMTYLFITHDFSAVRALSDRVIVMYLGKIMESGSTEEVLAEPLHPYTQALIASVPVPDPRRRRERIVLAGETPSATQPIVGCPFKDRCPHVMPDCRSSSIPLHDVKGRNVACLLYGEGAKGTAAVRASAARPSDS